MVFAQQIRRQLGGQTRYDRGVREIPGAAWQEPSDNQTAEYKAAFWLAWAHRGVDVPLRVRIEAKRAAVKLLEDAEGSHWNPLDRRAEILAEAAAVLEPAVGGSGTARYAVKALRGQSPSSSALTRGYDTVASAGDRAVDAARDFAVSQVDRATGAVKRRARQEANRLARRAQAAIVERVKTAVKGVLLASLLGVGVFGAFILWRRSRRS